jgi:hypothetical protein
MKPLNELNKPLPNGVAPGAPQPVDAPIQGRMLSQDVQPIYVQGMGLLGPDLGGSVRGAMLRQQYDLRNREDNRAERDQSIQEENQTMQRTVFQKEQAVQAGMMQAAQEGGYAGVINYLQNADPERALRFTKEKNDLDQALMKTDVMKAAVPSQIAQIQAEAYGTLGKMGAALLNAAPEDRSAMYENLLPMIKQINPDAPTSLNNKAVGMFMLAQAQATPANTLFSAQQQLKTTQTDMGKALEDLHTASVKYGPNSKQVQLLSDEVSKLQNTQNNAQLRLANTIANQGQQGEDRLRNQWLQNTKDFSILQNSYNNVVGAANNKDANGGPNDMALIYNYMKMLDPNSAVMPGEYANAENTAGVSDKIRQMYNKAADGTKLTPTQRGSFMDAAKLLYDNKLQGYNNLKAGLTEVAVKRGYDPKVTIIDRTSAPVQAQQQQRQQAPQAALEYLKQNPNTLDMFVQKFGYNPMEQQQ